MTWLVELWGGPEDGKQMEVPPEYNGAPPDEIRIAMVNPKMLSLDLEPLSIEESSFFYGVYRLRLEWNELLPIYDWMPYATSPYPN